MRKFYWKCIVCEEPILPLITCGQDKLQPDVFEDNQFWQNAGVAVLPDGKIVSGSPDSLGFINGQLIYNQSAAKPEVYHAVCYRYVGKPQQHTRESKQVSAVELEPVLLKRHYDNHIKEAAFENCYAEYFGGNSPSNNELDPSEIVSRLNADGTHVEKVSRVKKSIEDLGNVYMEFAPHVIAAFLMTIERHRADFYRKLNEAAEKINIESATQVAKIAEARLKIAGIFDKASDDIYEISKTIK